jgi:hypothetical protein
MKIYRLVFNKDKDLGQIVIFVDQRFILTRIKMLILKVKT